MAEVQQHVPPGAQLLQPANLVTLVRGALTCLVAAVAAQSLIDPQPPAVVLALGLPALALDGVDGWVARRSRSVTAFGARFDLEVDALLVLALSVYVAPRVGWWVLWIGVARYLLLLAQGCWPALRGEVRARYWRKVVAVTQGVALLSASSALLPVPVDVAVLAAALGLLVLSFGTEVVERLTGAPSRGRRREAVVAPVLAVVLVWLALSTPDGARHLSPWLLARFPLELAVLAALAALLPARWSSRLGLGFGLLAAPLLVVKLFNVGFTMVLDRPFDVVGDWSYFGSAVGVLADSTGRPLAVGAVAVLACAAVTLLVVLPLLARRLCREAGRRPRGALALAAGVPLLAVLLTMAGIGPPPQHRSFSAASVSVAVEKVRSVRADLRDRAVFAQQIAHDPLAEATSRTGLLRRLEGQDVLLVFVESYGRSALEDPALAPAVTAALRRGTGELRAAGYDARSAYLTSPTFGAASWLAHSSAQSGLWVASQRRYNQLLGSDRLTLTRAFGRAGWRTVLDAPSVTDGWSEGQRFYGFDRLYDASNVGYRGPAFGYATMPDQYTLARLRDTELSPADRRPVMAEVDLVSSHHPWAPLPRLVAWDRVGDGSVFDPMPAQGDTAEHVLSDPARVRAAYVESVVYSLDTLVSFLTTYPDDDLVVLMLGDHQPHHYVSGDTPGYDVPVTLLSRDPSVLGSVSGWGWSPGLRPSPDAPVWRMDSLRDRFLTAFSAR